MKPRTLPWLMGITISLFALLVVAAACGDDDDDGGDDGGNGSGAAATVGDLTIMAPSARAALDKGAVYMTVENTGDTDDAMISAATSVAGKVELHETVTEGNTSSMQPVELIDVPAGGEAVLERGGLHVMLMDLKEELKVGDKFDISVTFKEAGSVTFEVTVAEYAESDPGMNGMDNGMGDGMGSASPTPM